MLVSKAAIQKELGARIAEFAPPGERLLGLFEDEYGDTPFLSTPSLRWREEATAFVAATYGQQGHPQQPPYPPAQPGYGQQQYGHPRQPGGYSPPDGYGQGRS